MVRTVEIGEYSALSTRLWKAKGGKTLKCSIFEFYSKLYHAQNKAIYVGEKSLLSQKVKEIFIIMTWCFQTMSLLWIPRFAIKNWAENWTMWEIIGYLRLDNICSELGMIFEYFYISIIMIFIIFLCVIAMILIDYLSKNIPNSILSIFKSIFDLWNWAFLIPSLTLYSVFLKYNFLSRGYVTVYKDNNSADFELNAVWLIVIILTIILIFPLIISYEEFFGELRHSVSSKVLKAKAHSKVDVHITIFTYFSPILYALADEDFMIYFQLYMMIISLILIAEIIIFLPYFSPYFCMMKILGLFAISLVSFGFILGFLMDNSQVIILIAIILGPLSALFVIQFILKLYQNLSLNIPETLSGIESAYQLEKSLRSSLCFNDLEHKDQIINLFETFFTETGLSRNKLQLIWEANYCLFTLKDESLAKVKLSRIKNILEWNLEADFQEYFINNNIQNSLSSENSQFISYLQQLHLIKTNDIKLCINLLKFWEELTSCKPDLNRLIKRLAWINKKTLLLANEYSQLTTKFINSESLSLCASYMKDIIFDKDKAIFFENKLKQFNINVMNPDSNHLSYFDDLNAILIISAEEDGFGRILFSNKIAKDILKFNSLNIDGGNIMSFIPSYYSEKLKECAISYSHFCSDSEIDLSGGFFLDVPSESLIECTGNASITTIGNCLVFILIFKQTKKNNQIALLSENGEILCHSKNFAEMAGKGSNNLVGYNIKNIFHESEKYLNNKGASSESCLIYSSIQVIKLKIFYAVLASDSEEIQRWRNKDAGSLPNKKRKYEKISHQSLSGPERPNKGIKKEYEGEISFNSEMNLNHSGQNKIHEIIEKHFSENYSSEKSESWQNKKFTNLVASSSRKINILHVAFILSILSVLGTNIAVLFYAFSNINFIRNMDLPIAVGDVDSRLQHVALTSRIIWSLSQFGGPEAAPAVYLASMLFPGFLNSLKDLYLNITSNLADWNYCSGQSIFTAENVKIWSSSETNKVNLLDLLAKSIQSGNEFIRKFKDTEDYTDEITFLTLNSFGEVSKYCNDSLYQVIDCQKSIMLDFKMEVYILLLLGIGVLALCVCAMIPFCISAINFENDLWNNLRKRAYENHSELKHNLLDRIKYVHCQSEFLFHEKNPSNKNINFKKYWKYIWRIFIYFLVVAAFSFTNIALLYEKCTDYLSYRPDVMKEMINRQILQNSLAIWATLSQFETWGIPSINQYFNIYPYMNSSTEFRETVSLLEQSKVKLRNPKYSPILSSSFKTTFYENDHYLSVYFTYGTSPAEEILLKDSYFYAYSNPVPAMWVYWVLNTSILNEHYASITNEIDDHSQHVIETQVNLIVSAFVIFAISSIGIYFALYFVFFKREKQCLEKISSIMKLMPK